MMLIAKDADADGWATASSVVWPLVADLPSDLVELEPVGDAGRARLTDIGAAVLSYT